MIDYEDLLYEDYEKLIDEIKKYNKHFLSKPPLEKIRLTYYYMRDIGSRDLSIITAHKKILTKNIILKNYE